MFKPICILVGVALCVVSAAAQATNGTQVIKDAAAALGGESRIAAIKTLVIEGGGSDWHSQGGIYGSVTPTSPASLTDVTDFKRSIDLANGRMALTQTRTDMFPFALALVARTDARLDGEIAYNVANGRPARVFGDNPKDRRIELLSHPIMIVLAALDPAAKVSAPRSENDQDVVDITTAKGDALTLAVNTLTKLPASVSWKTYDALLGDLTNQWLFSDYEDVSGVKLPKRFMGKTDRQLTWDIRVAKNTVDGDVGNLAAPEAVKTATPPAPPPPAEVTADEVGKGIWWIGGAAERSMVFEFADHLTIFELPISFERGKAVIEKARTLSTKPVTTVIVSHHHLDHAGGIKAAVVEGLTIVTYKDNVPFFKELLARRHTLGKDVSGLATTPKVAKFQMVDDSLILKDSAMEVRLYHVKGDTIHCNTEIMAWVPRDRILVEADLYDKTWQQHPWGENFIWNVEQVRKLNVDKMFPIHGNAMSNAEAWPEVKETLALKPHDRPVIDGGSVADPALKQVASR